MKKQETKLLQMRKLVEVLNLLPEDGSPIQAKKIKQEGRKRRISPNTVFKYLGKLEKISLVLKKPDLSSRPPGVYYKRVTEEELFGEKKTAIVLVSALEQFLPMLKNITKKLPPSSFKRIWLELRLAYFTAFITLIEAKASTIESQHRGEFIETMVHIHLLPKLLRLSREESIKLDDWIEGLSIPIKMYQKSLKVLHDEIEKVSPGFSEKFAKLLVEAIDKQKPSDETLTEIEKLIKSVKVLKSKLGASAFR